VETHEKLAIYAGSHARGNLPFIHLCNEWSCTPEIRVKTYIFKPGYYEKVWERVAMHKKSVGSPFLRVPTPLHTVHKHIAS